MRKIKFRGVVISDVEEQGSFIYGGIVMDDAGNYCIIPKKKEYQGSFFYRVDSRTVGQYAGLKDKNGVEIYEGDYLELEDCNKLRVDVCFECGSFGIMENTMFVAFSDVAYDYEIIGNIHEGVSK